MKAFKLFLLVWATLYMVSGLIASQSHAIWAGVFIYSVLAVTCVITKTIITNNFN